MVKSKKQALSEVERELYRIEPDDERLLGLGSKAIPELRRLWRTAKDPRMKGKAVYALTLLDDGSELVARAVKSSIPEVRFSLAVAAMHLPLQQAEEVLFPLLEDPDPLVAHTAANHVPIPSRGYAMARKKPEKRPTSAPSNAKLCEEGGPEILATIVSIHAGDRCEFRYRLCKTTALVRVYLTLQERQGRLLKEAHGEDEIRLVLRSLPVGRHLLHWGFQGAGLQWQTRAEFLVNGDCRFRHRKSDKGNDPVNRGFLVVEVLERTSD